MSIDENKAIARRWAEEIWGKGDVSVIDQIVAPDYIDHEYATPPRDSANRLKEAVTRLHATFSNMRTTLEAQIAEGDKVVNLLRTQGAYEETATTSVGGATSRDVSSRAVDIFRIVDGKIVERWNVTDTADTIQQLDDIPPLRQFRR